MTYSIKQAAILAKKATYQLAVLNSVQKNNILLQMAQNLRDKHEFIEAQNAKDIEFAKNNDLSSAMIDRLTLDKSRIDKIADSLEYVASLPDPVGETSGASIQPNGIQVSKVRIPLGVVAMIYESRPNVTADAAALCLKSGNSVILRGGKEALHSNLAIAECLQAALEQYDINPAAVTVIPDPDRGIMQELLTLNEQIDLVIPRGGEGLIRYVTENSRIPVIQHYKGVCHLFVDKLADLNKALKILDNGKTQRPGVCNALETLLIHRDVAAAFLPDVAKLFTEKGVKVRSCPRAIEYFKGAVEAEKDDYHNEYLDLEISVKVVDGINSAIEHIHKYSSGHTEVIVTQDISRSQQFLKAVNSSVVMVNASSRFSDGGELGLGAEIGISTSKLHAYGPMGLTSLTTEKYVIYGDGQIRE